MTPSLPRSSLPLQSKGLFKSLLLLSCLWTSCASFSQAAFARPTTGEEGPELETVVAALQGLSWVKVDPSRMGITIHLRNVKKEYLENPRCSTLFPVRSLSPSRKIVRLLKKRKRF